MITIEVPVKPVRNLTMTSMVILDQNLLRLVEVDSGHDPDPDHPDRLCIGLS
jgi:hypothetical protein